MAGLESRPMPSAVTPEGAFQNRLRAVARAVAAAGAVGAVGLTLYTGRHNNSRLLMLAFAIWVLSPFVGFLMADARATRWSSPARTTLHGTMLLVTAATLTIYGVVALGPPRPKPASFFLVVPPASVALLAVAVSIAASRSRRASR